MAKAVVQPEGGRSTSAENRGKQTAEGPVDSSEGYLKRITELEEVLRRAKARGKRLENVQVLAAKRRSQGVTTVAFVAAFSEPEEEGESLKGRRH